MSEQSKAVVPKGMTNVVGYYNAQKWPIQLFISRLNVTLVLEPGAYLMDDRKRKINDPFFEVYVKNKQLKAEISDKTVPVLLVPVPGANRQTALAEQQQQSGSVNPVRAAKGFALDSEGIRRPVMEAPVITTPPQTNSEPVKAMTMEEARARGLVRKVREVPEDYGVTETSGAPTRRPPPIRYSIDPGMLQKPPPLPSELLNVSRKEVGESAGTRSSIISQLKTSASAEATPERATSFMNQAVPNAPANAQITAGQTDEEPVAEAEPEPVMEEQPEPEFEQGEENQPPMKPVMEMLPEPDLTELQESTEEPLPSSPPTQKPVAANGFVCPECQAEFKFRRQIVNHANSKHSDKAAEIIAQYPAA